MTRPSHYGAAFLSYAGFALLLTHSGYIRTALLGTVIVSFLVRIPDFEKRIPGLGHRGLLHTVWCAVLVGLFVAFVSGLLCADRTGLATLTFAAGGFLVGVSTIGAHLVVDVLTPAGVTPFAPFSARTYTYGHIRANHLFLNYFLLLLGVAVLGSAFIFGTGIS